MFSREERFAEAIEVEDAQVKVPEKGININTIRKTKHGRA